MNKKGCKTCKSYSYKSGTRKIETEGREPVFDSKGELIYYNPNDSTHSEGGVKAFVVPKDTYSTSQLQAINKTSSTKIFPEGSSIVTAEKGKADKAIIAYKTGNKQLLNKIIKSMPEDKASKYKKGTDYISNYNTYKKGSFTADGYKYKTINGKLHTSKEGIENWVRPNESQYNAINSQYFNGSLGKYVVNSDNNTSSSLTGGPTRGGYGETKGYKVTPEEIQANQEKQSAYENSFKYGLTPEQSKTANDNYTKESETAKKENSYSKGKYIADLGVSAASNIPMWYNLMMGKQDAQKEQRNYIPKVSLNDNYNIQASKNNITNAYRNKVGIINDNVGTSQNRLALTTTAYNDQANKTNELLANKANYLTNLKNQETMTNNQIDAQNVNLKNNYNDLDSRNRGAKQQFNRTAAEQAKQGINESINYANKNYQDHYNRISLGKYFDEKSKTLSKYQTTTSDSKTYVDSDGSKYKLDTDGKSKLYLQSKGNRSLKYKTKKSC